MATIDAHFTYNERLDRDSETGLTHVEAAFCHAFASNPETMGNKNGAIIASKFSPTLDEFHASDDERIAVANRLLKDDRIKRELTRIASERKNTKLYDRLLLKERLLSMVNKLESAGDYRGAIMAIKELDNLLDDGEADGPSEAAALARAASAKRRQAMNVVSFNDQQKKAE